MSDDTSERFFPKIAPHAGGVRLGDRQYSKTHAIQLAAWIAYCAELAEGGDVLEELRKEIARLRLELRKEIELLGGDL